MPCLAIRYFYLQDFYFIFKKEFFVCDHNLWRKPFNNLCRRLPSKCKKHELKNIATKRLFLNGLTGNFLVFVNVLNNIIFVVICLKFITTSA